MNKGGPRGRDRDQPRPGSIKAETQSQLNHRPHQGAGHQQPHQNPVIAVPAKAKKPRPPHCHRCKVSGHTMLECKADLDCFVCNKKNSHRAERCPVLKLPKPTGNLFGFGKTETGFLQIPDFDFKFDTPSPVPTALVSIGGGHLSADNVQGELARLVRADWKWEAIPHEQNSYLVTFPSAEELKRMDDVEFRLKNHGVSLSISDWKSSTDVTPAYQLDEVWVHITGVPHKWRHYLAFWALGCVVGVTQEVDMLTFRQKGIIRVRVALLSRADLPITTDLLFGTMGYPVTFALEEEGFEPAIPLHDDPMDHDDDGVGDKDDTNNGGDDQIAKCPKKSEASSSSQGQQPISDVSSMQLALTPFGSVARPEAIQANPTAAVHGAVGVDVKPLTGDSARAARPALSRDQVVRRDKSPVLEAMMDRVANVKQQPVQSAVLIAASATTRGAKRRVHTAAADVDQQSAQPAALVAASVAIESIKQPVQAATTTVRVARHQPSTEQLGAVAAGNIQMLSRAAAPPPEGAQHVQGAISADSKRDQQPERRWSRRSNKETALGVASADVDSLTKAISRKAEKNLEIPATAQGTSKSPSISSTTNLCSMFNQVGISLGTTATAFDLSVNNLRHMHIDRSKVYPKKHNSTLSKEDFSHDEMDPFLTSDNEGDDYDNALLAHLVKDISEVDLDEVDQSTELCDLFVSSRKSKPLNKKKGRKAKSVKSKKSNKVS